MNKMPTTLLVWVGRPLTHTHSLTHTLTHSHTLGVDDDVGAGESERYGTLPGDR